LIAPLAGSLCPLARSARRDVRWEAAVFVESDETTGGSALFSYRFVGSSCRSAARTSRRGSRLARAIRLITVHLGTVDSTLVPLW
jgi:hypothetical protein